MAVDLLPCPFCGGAAKTMFHNGTTQVSCAGAFTECAGSDVMAPVEMWNRRSDRAGLLAGLREAEATARQLRERWSCAGGFGDHSVAARIIADTLSARIAALET